MVSFSSRFLKMMKRNNIKIIILLLISFLVIIHLLTENINSHEKLAADLFSDTSILMNNNNILIRHTFSNVAHLMGIERKISINSQFNKEEINIFIIDFDELKNKKQDKKIGKFSSDKFINLCRENFIAFPPNLVVIDGNFLDFLSLEAYNYSIAAIQARMFVESPDQFGYDEIPYSLTNMLDKLEAYNTLMRINNYKMYKDKSENDFKDSTYTWVSNYINQAARIGYTFLEDSLNNVEMSIGTIQNRRIDGSWTNEDTIISPVLVGHSAFFVPIVAHELSHLKLHKSISGQYLSPNQVFRQISSKYEEENEADSLAILVTNKYIWQNSIAMSSVIQNIIGFCKTMRDIVLIETYDGFRQIELENLFVNQEMGIKNKEVSEFVSDDPFENATFIYRVNPPIPTEQEFNLYSKELDKRGSNIVHRHLLARCKTIIDSLDENFGAHLDKIFEPYLGFVENKESNSNFSRELYTGKSFKNGLGITINIVENNLSDMLYFEDAINYQYNGVKIGKLLLGIGYVEIHSDTRTDEVKFVKYVFNNRNIDNSFDNNDQSIMIQNTKIQEKLINMFGFDANSILTFENYDSVRFQCIPFYNYNKSAILKWDAINCTSLLTMEIYPYGEIPLDNINGIWFDLQSRILGRDSLSFTDFQNFSNINLEIK